MDGVTDDLPSSSGAGIFIDSLTHTYNAPEGTLTVLNDISFEIPAGGYVSITGPSGAGKSTLLSLLGGLESPQQGSLNVGNFNLSTMKHRELANYRSRVVGFVFQHFGLLETLTASENIELACTLTRVSPNKRRERSAELLAAVGLEHRKDHRPLHLSGGERQRVAIARALANSPSLVLADEPTGNLDDETARTVIDLLEQITREREATLVVVTHNLDLAHRATSRLLLDSGQIVGTSL